MTPLFRKKPVTVEAFQMTHEQMRSNVGWPKWLYEAFGLDPSKPGSFFMDMKGDLVIHTLEGTHRVSVNDWIIKGVQGELYPCKPDIFEKTYERVEE